MVDGRERGGGRNREDKQREMKERDQKQRVPVGTMMFSQVERRLDVLVFRACFATSVWQAKSFVVHGKVKLNGEVVSCSRLSSLGSVRLKDDLGPDQSS